MSYRVVYTAQAARELEAAADWWAVHRDSDQAVRWYTGFSERIATLRDDPERFSLADENEDFPCTIRELHFGVSSRPTHRAIYTIEDAEKRVLVLTILHVARDRITPDDLTDVPEQ